jgi:hypothetical protein
MSDPASPDDALPRADVAYLFLISKSGPFVVLRVPAESEVTAGHKGREKHGGRYLPKWSELVSGAKAILAEHGLPPEDFLMLDRIVEPWDWMTPWGGKLLMVDLRLRALMADAAFDGHPEMYRKHYLYDWVGKAFTRVRGPLETAAAPTDAEPKGTP